MQDLRGSLQGNDKLDELLRNSVSDKAKLEQVRQEIGATEGSHE
jgi:predicted component of type VI protein secretion system